MLQDTIIEKLTAAFQIQHLEVENESHMHNVEPGSESHIRIVAVASIFDGINLVKRHKLVYKHLSDALDGPVHAVSLHTFSPTEWLKKNGETTPSPDCLGGSS